MMVILYEVTCRVNQSLFAEYLIWLREHVNHLLSQPGFLSAEIGILDAETSEVAEGDTQTLTIWYRLENKQALLNYFSGAATAMRAEGIQRFGANVTIERRIFEVI